MQAITTSGHRIAEIDALRGIAAVFVVLGHYTLNYDHLHNLKNSLGFHFWIGNYGVYLFFVISGFVILLTLHRSRTGLDFMVSRFSRIFPAYWSALLITSSVLYLLHSRDTPTVGQLALNFTMLERFFNVYHVDEVYWTLNVELSFYCWMLLVFKMGWLNRINTLIPVVLAFQAIVEGYSRVSGHFFSQGADVVFLLEYAHLFCAGMLFYEAREKGFTPLSFFLLLWCFLNQSIVNFRSFDWILPNIYGAPAVLFFFIIMFMIVRGGLRWLGNPFFLFLGTISYTLYLLHNEIGRAVREATTASGLSAWTGFVSACGVSLFLAVALTFLVEKPAMRWIRNKYRPRNTPGLRVADST